MTVRVKDRGWNEFLSAQRKLKRRRVAVGVFGSSGRSGDDVSNAELAAIHEFGTDRIPARSFLGGTLAATRRDLERFIDRTKRRVDDGDISVDQGLNLIGQKHAADVQEFIADGVAPANAAVTIERKGSSTPLIDTGQLRQSIDYELRDD